ncbi:hypothetical protein N3K66_003459 [Trichothecium roseum]|uniref:Uncharacterized protein n=1 Tax=Trichothecium roseum TaxID=47278 RepID=A0ACC0V835_9HYPO|nr:hypothetical protein N3K66_003459 [Trichothecium roseum]
MRLPNAAALLGLLPLALAADLTIYLSASNPNPFTLPASTHATLTTARFRLAAPLSAVNTFVFHNVTPGSYLADVHCPTDGFAPLRIDVKGGSDSDSGIAEAWETYRGNEWDNKGERLEVKEGSAGLGVEIKASGRKNYYSERAKFSVFTILKNPMILMGGVSMLLFIGMPKILENMDPEIKAEFEARQKEGPMSSLMGGGGGGSGAGGQQNPIGDFDMAAYLAGSNKKDAKSQQGVRRS